jgi:hypothetical protein
LIYEDKGSARGRAFVRVGVPIAVDDQPAGAAEDDREAVGNLTERIERHLSEAALDYQDAAHAADLFFAAQVALRRTGGNPAWTPALSALERTAGALARADPGAQRTVREAAGAYRAALEANDQQDRIVAAGTAPKPGAARVLGGILTVLALPFAVIGAVVNALPALAVHLAGRRPAPPVTLATIKFLVGFVLFPLDWLILRYVLLDGTARPWVWTVLLGPVCGLVAAVVGDRLRRIRLARLRPERMLLPDRAADDLAERRAWLVEQVAAAVDGAGQGPETAGSLDHRP